MSYPVEFIGGPLDGIVTSINSLQEDFKCKLYLDEHGDVLDTPTIDDITSTITISYKLMKCRGGMDHTVGGLFDGRWIMVETNFWPWYHFSQFYSSRTY